MPPSQTSSSLSVAEHLKKADPKYGYKAPKAQDDGGGQGETQKNKIVGELLQNCQDGEKEQEEQRVPWLF